MKKETIIKVLKNYNNWRRDNKGIYEQPNPKQLGIAIDLAIKELEK